MNAVEIKQAVADRESGDVIRHLSTMTGEAIMLVGHARQRLELRRPSFVEANP